jgi:hypothetical protein
MKKNLSLFTMLLLSITGARAQDEFPVYLTNLVSDTNFIEVWLPFNGNADNTVSDLPATELAGYASFDRQGNPESAYDFDFPTPDQSTAQVITSPIGINEFTGSTTGFAVNLWMQPNLDPDNSGVLAEAAGLTNSVINYGWRLQLFAGDSIRAIYQVDAANLMVIEVATDIYSDDILDGHSGWHMVTFSVNSSEGSIYVDGQFLASSNWTGVAGVPANLQPLKIGCSAEVGNANQYVGKIDDVVILSNSLTAAEISTLFTQSPAAIAGCTNTNACNFINDAIVDDYTCKFDCIGCIQPGYCNYNDNATIPGPCDASCIEDTSMVLLFLDLNTNGIFDAGETTIEGWPVRVTNADGSDTLFTLFSNRDGYVMATAQAASYRYRADFNENNWIATTDVDTLLTFPNNDDSPVFFGFSPIDDTPEVYWEHVPSIWQLIDCVYGYGEGVYLQNTGGLPIFGTIELTTDTLLLPGGDFLDTTQPDSTSVGYAAWSNISIPPGERELFTFHANPVIESLPTEGEIYLFSYHIQLSTELGPILDTTYQFGKTTFCGVTSDTVIATPAGYDQPHYVLDSTRIHYRIVFKYDSIGFRSMLSDTLEQVLLKQNLNTSLVDIQSLELLYTTTEATVRCLHDDGTMDLLMPGAFLVEEAQNPLQSFIILEYSVQLRDNLDHGGTLNQVFTMYELDPQGIEENTGSSTLSYFHTIFDCNSILTPADTLACTSDSSITINAGQDYVQSWSWFRDGNFLQTGASYVLEGLPSHPAFIPLSLTMSNPLCVVERDVNVYVYEPPFTGLDTQNENNPEADFAEFYQWYQDIPDSLGGDTLIPGATESIFNSPGPGNYYCVMTLGGCVVQSETIETNTTSLSPIGSLKVWPNPFSYSCTVALPDRGYSVSLYDATGRMMRTWSACDRQLIIDRSDLSSGFYILRAQKENTAFATRLIVE